MKSTLALAAFAAVVPSVTALFDDVQDAEQDSGNINVNLDTAWRCGHALYRGVVDSDSQVAADSTNAVQNPKAKVVLLKDRSLNYIRSDTLDMQGLTADEKAARNNQDYGALFCSEYVSGYKNPAFGGQGGVCIRDGTPGKMWDAIVAADNEAKALWELFGTSEGYMKSTPKAKTIDNAENAKFGSGHSGDNPANWCSAYMKELLCHVAFPQWTGTRSEWEDTTMTAVTGKGQRVRPVGLSECTGMMDTCNRHQPEPYNAEVSWINVFFPTEGKNKLDNKLYCEAWNKGFGLARVC